MAGASSQEADETIVRPSSMLKKAGKPKMGNIHMMADLKKASKPAATRLADTGVLADFLLDALAYSSMRDREAEVTVAHAKTFDWIFSPSKSGNDRYGAFGDQFIRWLSTNDLGPIYWITGKPGSGKSTLLRFLFEHPTSAKYLSLWAGERGVSLASFFFWTSGSQEQKSQTGLLRSLLHQLLSRHRDLIPEAFPELWERLLGMTTKDRVQLKLDWTALELMNAFQTFMAAATRITSICLFIDGLDEFNGDHSMIIDFFKGLVANENGDKVKLCLSSRPWPVFEAAFEYAVPNLKLQDLTYDDMYRYAFDRLHREQKTSNLVGHSASGSGNLVGQIVNKADGVFLWVRLAVDQILERLTPGADKVQFIDIINSLPAELDDLFNHLVFEHRSASQISESGQLFQLFNAREIVSDFLKDESSHSLTSWELAFAVEKTDDDAVMSANVQQIYSQEIERRLAHTQDCIHRTFSGLLDVYTKSRGHRAALDGKVTYIHRTVRDWLMEDNKITTKLVDNCPADFDPHLRLLRSYILRMKQPVEEHEQHRRLDEWWPDIALAMTHARHVSNDAHRQLRPFVNELDRALSWYWVTRSNDPGDHWARSAFGTYEARMKAPPIQHPFLCLAAKFGLTKYIHEELDAYASSGERTKHDNNNNNDDDNDDQTHSLRPAPLLCHATEFLCSRNKTIYPLSDPTLVQILLTCKSTLSPGPNYIYADFWTRTPRTPWIALLRHLRDAKRRGWISGGDDMDSAGIARWSEIVQLFLRHGADPYAVVVADKWDPEITAMGVFEMLDETYGAAGTQALTKVMKRLTVNGEIDDGR